MAEENGVWRTIRGRRVFIRDGEDLGSAMKRSGKFGTKFSPEETAQLRKQGREAKAREIDKINQPAGEQTRQLIEEMNVKTFADEIKENKTIHTQSGSYSSSELKNRDESIKQMYKDAWSGNKSYKELHTELESMKSQGKISQGELDSLKYDASREMDNWQNNPKNAHRGEYIGNNIVVSKEKEEQTIPREKANAFVNAFKTALEEEQNGYTQTVDWDGGTYEYSKDRLERMEQSGIKPLEHSYTGGGWQGTKYDSKLTTKEIAKTVQDDLKKNYPGVKISRKTDYNSIDINIMSSDKDLYKTSFDIDKMDDKTVSDTIRDSIGGYTRMDDWLNKNNRKNDKGTYTVKDQKDYLKEELETYRNRQGSRVSGGEWYLSDYGKEVVGSLNKNLNSYNYDDSDGMVDYFDTNFYGGVQIGKWDKPFVVEDKKIEAKIERYKKRKNK